MTDSLQILITAKLNEALSEGEINAQIASLQEKIAKLDIKLNIDKSAYSDLINQIQQVNNLSKQLKLYDRSQLEASKIEVIRDIDQVIEKYKSLGTVRVNKTFDPITKELTGLMVQVDKANGLVDKFKYNLLNIDNGTTKPDKLFVLDGLKQTDTTQKVNQKVALDNEKFLLDLDKAHYQALQENNQRDQKAFAASLKQKELIDKSHYQAIEEDAKRSLKQKEALLKQEEALDKAHYQALQEDAKRDLKEQQNNLKQKEILDKAYYQALQEEAKRQSKTDQEQYSLDLYKRNQTQQVAALKHLAGNAKDMNGVPIGLQLDDYLKQVNALTVATPNLSKRLDDLKLKFKDIGNSVQMATGHTMNFGKAFETAMIKFPIWMAASTLFFQSFRFITDGIQYVADLNKELTQISIVTGQSQQRVEELGRSYQKLGMNMSVTTKELAQGAVEFYRQGLSQADVMDKLAATTKYAKISNLDFNESAKILTATVNSMNIDVNKAIDVFSYLGKYCPLVA